MALDPHSALQNQGGQMIPALRKKLLENIELMEAATAELEARELAIAEAAERPWADETAQQCRRLGADNLRQQVLALVDQHLGHLHHNAGTASILRALREQILSLSCDG